MNYLALRMAVSRRSDCPISLSLELFGDKWTFIIIRDIILFDKRHFKDFAKQEGIATNILTDRLKKLMANKILIQDPDPGYPVAKRYSLTSKGLTLIPILIDILEWGAVHTTESNQDFQFIQALRENRTSTLSKLHTRLAKLHGIAEQ